MKLTVKNKYLSPLGSSYVLDEQKKKRYRIKGTISFTAKKRILDMNRSLHYVVRNKFFAPITPRVFIYNHAGVKVATVSTNRYDFKNRYDVVSDTDSIILSGNLFQFPDMKLEITKNGIKIGTLTKKFNLMRDVFTIEADNAEEESFLIALVIAVDNIIDRYLKKSR
ncbi:MAG: hypothetical protein ACOX3K_05565 [Bacilli bacterium]|jgi:uncharacterized protein YxjI